jgi:hypothetical protein
MPALFTRTSTPAERLFSGSHQTADFSRVHEICRCVEHFGTERFQAGAICFHCVSRLNTVHHYIEAGFGKPLGNA